jgi:hypothetical protein
MQVPSYDDFYDLERRLDSIEEKLESLIEMVLGNAGYEWLIYNHRTNKKIARFKTYDEAVIFFDSCKTKSNGRKFYRKSLLGQEDFYQVKIKKVLAYNHHSLDCPLNPETYGED